MKAIGIWPSWIRTVRLWLSHQRYALMAGCAAVALAGVVYTSLSAPWWALLTAAMLSLGLGGLALRIMAQWKKKMRITERALRQIERGRFDPDSMAKYCTDPCWRVVVTELLREYGLSRVDRRRLIREYTEMADAAGATLVIVNRHDHVVYTMENGQVHRAPLHSNSGSA